MRLILSAALLAVAAPLPAQTGPIQADAIKEDVRILSSDTFQGRGPGERPHYGGLGPWPVHTQSGEDTLAVLLMVEDLGIDYINKRNSEIEAVTIADAKQVAARLLKVDDLIVTVVGKPEGLLASTR